MFQKIKPYIGSYIRYTYLALVILFLALIASAVPFFMVYRMIAPLLYGETLSAGYFVSHTAIIFVCELVYAILCILGLKYSHIFAYNTLKNIRISLQKRLEHPKLMGAGASDRYAEPPCDGSSRQLLADTDTGKQQRDHAVFQHFGNFSVSECYPAHFIASQIALHSSLSVGKNRISTADGGWLIPNTKTAVPSGINIGNFMICIQIILM